MKTYATNLASKFLTIEACHWPPRRVLMCLSLSAFNQIGIASHRRLIKTAVMLILSIAISENSVLVNSVYWIAGLITGSLATGIAAIAIAAIGFSMLGGRISVRCGASAMLGCFLLFGAPAIGQALSNLARSDETAHPDNPYSAQGSPPPLPDIPPYDPYGGASLIK